jgi:hypothetical protein
MSKVDMFGGLDLEQFNNQLGIENTSDKEEKPEVEEVPVEVEEVVTDGNDKLIDEEVEEKETVEETVEAKEETETTETEETEVEDNGYGSLMQYLVDEDIAQYDEDKEYDLSEKGLKELINDTVESSRSTAISEYKDKLDDEAKTLLTILEDGGSIQDYFDISQQVDFSKVDVSNEEFQQYLVEDWMKISGYSDSEIQELIEDYSSSGILEKQAKIAQKKLVAYQSKENEKKLQKLSQEKEQREAEEREAAEGFKNEVLSAREIKGFKITEKKAKDLYSYLTTKQENGKTKAQNEIDAEDHLLLAYLKMEGYNLDTVKKEIASKQAIKLKKKLNNFRDSNASHKGGNVERRQNDKLKINWNFGSSL